MENLESKIRKNENEILSQMCDVLVADTTYRSRILLIRELLSRHDSQVKEMIAEIISYHNVELPF